MNKNPSPDNTIPTKGERPKLLPPELVNEFDDINTAIGELESKFKAMVSELVSSQTKILSERIAGLENRPRPKQLVASSNNVLLDRIKLLESELKKARSSQVTLSKAKSKEIIKNDPANNDLVDQTTKPDTVFNRPTTLAGLITYLNKLGINHDNKRPLGGGLWVYLDRKKFAHVEEHLKIIGIDVKYYPHGRTRKPGPQFEIDPGKILE